MVGILVVDAKRELNEAVCALNDMGNRVRHVTSQEAAIRAIDEELIDIAFVSGATPDDGLVLLRELRISAPTLATVFIGDATIWAIAAMRAGALDFVSKPVAGMDVVSAVNRLNERLPGLAISREDCECHSLARWATVVVRALAAQSDPRTLAEWGHVVGVSTGGLRNWCRTAGLSSRQSLMFARTLRAVVRRAHNGIRAQDLLDIVDQRTLTKVLIASGGDARQLPATVDDFLSGQRFITSSRAIAEVRRVLSLHSPAKYQSLADSREPDKNRRAHADSHGERQDAMT